MRRKAHLFWAPIFCVIAVFVFAVSAQSQRVLNLPPGPVSVVHGPWLGAILGGTIDITLSGVPVGYDVSDGTYVGWCSEDNFQPDAGPGLSTVLYDSTDTPAALPPTYQGVPWNKVNYLLNHKLGTLQEIQAALWIIMNTDASSPTFPTTPTVTAMVTDADTFGGAFVPSYGQVVAVIIYADGLGAYGASPDNFQDTLIEVQVPRMAGCTLTLGYWKNHSSYGPAKPYDNTWACIGEDTPFYLSGKTYLEALSMPSSTGNAYYILARQFIAAKLNICSGAGTTVEVAAAMAWADSFFKTYMPSYDLKADPDFRKQVIKTSKLLDSYNNGDIGPGHCPED